MGAATILIPLIPGLIQSVLSIVTAIRGDPGTPDEIKIKLDNLSAGLKAVVAEVAAVQLPNKPA